MDLAELKFVVDTKQLEDAAKKIEALGVAVSKVNKPVTDAALKSEKLAAAQAKTAEATTKAATAQLKLSQAQEKSNSTGNSGNAIAERHAQILKYQTEGYSKGQAATLAAAKAAGAFDDVLEKLGITLKDQRTLMGGEPFDKSIGLMQKLENETRISTEVNNLFNKSLGLTEKQMIDLAREHERLIKKYELEGRSVDGLTAEYDQLIQKSTELNRMNDARTKNIRDQVKAQNDAAKATAYVADVDARLAAALDVTNSKLDKQATDAFVKYEKGVRLMGLSAEETATKLAGAKTQFEAIADKKQADKLQYLARAISVQMGDVGISLASGMNPLLVMIQQGDQIRGAIQDAGASGKELEKAMSGAATQIATSFIDTGKAIGGFFVNAVKSAGQAIFGLPIELARASFASLAGSADTSAAAFERLKLAAIGFSKVGIIAIIAGLAVLGKMMYDSLQLERELSVALATTGSAMNMNRAEAIDYAKSLATTKNQTIEYTDVILAMAKAGFKAGDNFKLIANSAIEMQKYAGKPIAETVKAFQDLSEKPVEGIAKLVKESKNVSAEAVKLVNELARQGKMTEAVAVATREMAKANADATKQIAADAGYLERVWMDVITNIQKGWKRLQGWILGWGAQDTLEAQLADKQNKLATFNKGDARRDPAIGKALKDDIANLQEQLRLQGRLKTIQDENDKKAKATAEFEGLKNKYKIPEDETKKIIANIEEVGKKAGYSAEEINKLKAAYLATLPKAAAISVAPSKDLSIIQKDYGEQLKLAQGFAKDERDLLKARFDAGLIDRAEYVSKDLALLQQSEQKQLDVIDQFSAKYNKAFGDQAQLLTDALGKTKDPENRKKLIQDIENLAKDFMEFNATLGDTKAALASAFSTREQISLLSFEKAAKASTDALKEYIKTQDDAAENKRIDLELSDRLTNAYGVDAVRIKAIADETKRQTAEISKFTIAQAEARKAYQAALDDPNASGSNRGAAYQAYITARENADKAIARSRLEIAQAGIDAEVFYYKQEYDRISKGVADAIETALYEGGKAGSKKLRDLIIAELKKPITIVVKALVDATLGGLLQNLITGGSDGSGSIGSNISTASNLLSLYKNGSSAFNIGAQYAAGTMSAANAGGTLFANATGTGIDGLLATNGAYGTVAEGSMAASAAEFASYIPQIAAVLAIANIAGLFKSTETVGGGLTGTLGKGNIQSYQLTRESGTLLSGPDYAMADVKDSAVSAAIQNAFTVVKKANIEMASQLGLATDNIVNFTTQLGTDYVHPDIQQYGLVFDNLTPEQANTKIKEALASAGEEMAQTILGTFTQITDENKTLVTETKKGSNIGWLAGEYVRVGEKASEALARLSNSLISVNSAFKQVGFTLYDIGLAGADAASTLIDLFGGLSNFNQSIGFFYENFFTDSEKLANLSKDLTVEFDKLNLTLPSTREEFKQMVIAAQKAGDNQLVKNLIDLQYAFAELVPIAESASNATDSLSSTLKEMQMKILQLTGTPEQILAAQRASVLEATDPVFKSTQNYIFALEDVKSAQDDLTEARNREGEMIKSTVSNLKKNAESLRQFSQSLLLGSNTTLTPEQQYTESRGQFDAILATATGSAITAEEIAKKDAALAQLQGSATAFLNASRMYNASSSQYTEDFNLVQRALTSTADELEKQSSDAEKQLSALGLINKSTLSVAQAVDNLTLAQEKVGKLIKDEITALYQKFLGRTPEAGGEAFWTNSVQTGSTFSQISESISTSPEARVQRLYRDLANRIGETEGVQFWMNALTQGIPKEDIIRSFAQSAVSLGGGTDLAIKIANGTAPATIPGFAQGTNFVPDDMYAQIHKGERIIPAADNTRLFQSLSDRNETNAVLVAEIKNLRQEIVELREQQSKETATIVISNIDAQQKNAEHVGEAISKTSQESNWNAKVRETVKLK